MLFTVFLGILICSLAQAGPIRRTFNPDSATILTQSNSTGIIVSQPFRIPANTPITFAAFVTDSGAGNTDQCDSVSLTLQTGVDLGGNTILVSNSNWVDGCEIVLGWNKGIDERGEVRFLALDSINVGTYKVGGIARVILHSGTTGGGDAATASDTLEADVTIDAYVGWGGQE
jgi:hypothetical protein